MKFTCNNTVEIRDVGTSLGRVKDWYPEYIEPGVWNRIYASGLSSVPVCWSRLRLEREPEVDPLWVVREAGATASDSDDDD